MVLRNSRKPCIFNGFRAMTGIQRFYFDFLMLYTFWIVLSAGFRFDEIWYNVASFSSTGIVFHILYHGEGVRQWANTNRLILYFDRFAILLFCCFTIFLFWYFDIKQFCYLIFDLNLIVTLLLLCNLNCLILYYYTILLLCNFAILLFWN